MKIHNFEQNSPEWDQCRLGKFTASDAQAIATNGKGLQTLVYKKAAEIITGKAKGNYTNGDMDRGHELEDTARSNYEIENGVLVEKVGFCEMDKYTGCSPDGLVGDDGLVEIKCKDDANYVRYLYEKKVDSEYLWQMQMQMYVTDRQWVDYVVFNENFSKFRVERVMRDEDKISKIKAGLESGIELLNKILVEVKHGR
jgi:putative phage-type endonuclease